MSTATEQPLKDAPLTDTRDGRQAKRLLTARDIERFTQLDVKTIYSYAQRGLIPYVRIGKAVRFWEHEILAWLEERTYRPRRRPRVG